MLLCEMKATTLILYFDEYMKLFWLILTRFRLCFSLFQIKTNVLIAATQYALALYVLFLFSPKIQFTTK